MAAHRGQNLFKGIISGTIYSLLEAGWKPPNAAAKPVVQPLIRIGLSHTPRPDMTVLSTSESWVSWVSRETLPLKITSMHKLDSRP